MKIGVLISIDTNNTSEDIKNFSKKICMHIAAMSPMSINEKDLDVNFINKEKEILKEELKNQGKDNAMIDKILVGKIKKVISDNTLLGQKWIHNQDLTVDQAIKEFEKSKNITLTISKFIRYKVGEGIEVKKTDFNQEVQSLVEA